MFNNTMDLPLTFQIHLRTPEPTQFPTYMSIWPMEFPFQLTAWKIWFHSNWTLSLYLSLVYLMAIFSIQRCMQGRKPFSLRQPLLYWNLFLAGFSILGTFRTAPELFHVFQTENPWYTSICSREYHNVAGGFWSLLFTLSKGLELGDTLFIILRKQPLIFLHWYHHVTVLCYCWSTYSTYDSTGMWFVVLNFAVHSVMYSYYALRIMQIRVPRSAAMLITCLQLVQMVIGIGCNIFALVTKIQGRHCDTDITHIYWGLGMYTSYFILFANFFHHSYFKKSVKTA